MNPVVWTIAGSDSGGGAGIQADLKTFHDFSVYGCTAITALTAQNTQGVFDIQATSLESIKSQINALKMDILPQAIKIGMVYHEETINAIVESLNDINVPIVIDPVLVSTSGYALHECDFILAYESKLFKIATLLTPNIFEAEMLAKMKIHSFNDVEKAAQILFAKGARAVLIKGGDFTDPELSSDYFFNGKDSFWLNQSKIKTLHTHGTGCSLSAAITAQIAQGWDLKDALVVAKAYVHAGITQPALIGKGRNPIGHCDFSKLKHHFPWVSQKPHLHPHPFKKITQPIGRYPVVDNLLDLEDLCMKGIAWVQLRIKQLDSNFHSLCEKALDIANAHGVCLVINDHISTAIKIGSPAIHLGQEDMESNDISHIPRENTYLGLTAHNFFELAKAYAHHPSYLTMGPIFPTTSKNLPYPVIGIEKLKYIAQISPLPLVAVGGITLAQMQPILNTGCSGAAFIQASKDLIKNGRYDRALLLDYFSKMHQQRLLKAKVVCVGAGGLASGFLPYLAAAGIGEICIIDHDTVDYSNLHRQVIYTETSIGQLKALVAKNYLYQLNSQIKVSAVTQKLTFENSAQLLNGYSLIIDGTDSFEAHSEIQWAAKRLKIPLIAAAVHRNDGQCFYFAPNSLCYNCIFENKGLSFSECQPCHISGVLGITPAILGIMQANLAIQLLSGELNSSVSFFKTWNGAAQQWTHFEYPLHAQCYCQEMQTLFPSINFEEAIKLSDSEWLDVRTLEERQEEHRGGVHIPLSELEARFSELDSQKTYIVYCRSGARSQKACEWLTKRGYRVKKLVSF